MLPVVDTVYVEQYSSVAQDAVVGEAQHVKAASCSNVRTPFEHYMNNPLSNQDMDWSGKAYPRPDYLSSSRKRLAPQLLFKGGIFHQWRKKQVVVMDLGFFNTLPDLAPVPEQEAEVAWVSYDLIHSPQSNVYNLTKVKTVYTKFQPSLHTITTAEAGDVDVFVSRLQANLDQKLNPPDAPALGDAVLS
jgi:hypothetical protein